MVVYLTMGDAVLFGMVWGMIDRLDKLSIPYEIVPGISSFSASCALIKRQMVGLGLSHTAICLSAHDIEENETYFDTVASLKASLAIFMAVSKISLVTKVLKRHYPSDTPVVVVSKATWPEEELVSGTLETIQKSVEAAGVQDGMILVGEFIDKEYDYELERQFMERKRRERRNT
ncbi:MAG: hypothetical protein GX127_05275 [Eubacteriaceae bacterium]|nr:hypothetical protein [Eubacteriaceae bacterium]